MRAWLYQRLIGDPALQALIGDPPRLYQGESLTQTPTKKPFVVYNMGNESPHNQERRIGIYRYAQIYVHDVPGDYMRIDDVLEAIFERLQWSPPDPAYGLLEARWLETSRDLDDREMGTILKYSRWQLIQSQRPQEV